MADESINSEKEKDPIVYARKKNIISGVDNDTLFAVLGTTALGVAIYNLPQVQDFLRNVFKNMPQIPQVGGPHLPMQPQQQQQQQLQPNGQFIQPVNPNANEALVQPQAEEHEKIVQKAPKQVESEQKHYAQVSEEEGLQGNQYNSFNAIPDRVTEGRTSTKTKKPYVAGENVSAGY